MREWLSTRWYAPILLLGAMIVALLVSGIAVMERLSGEGAHAVVSPTWTTALHRAEAALEQGDTVTALSSWREAHAAAVRSGQWEGMIAVGDASRRLAEKGASRPDGLARARRAYLTALFRARREHSVEGSLRAADAFGALGDRDVLAQALRIAEQQAGRDPARRARVRAVAERWMHHSFATDSGDANFTGGHQP